jgi:D-alanyl-D-alanine carboxypeptidase
MKYLLSFFRKINSQVVIFLTATILVAIAIIITNQQPPTSQQNTPNNNPNNNNNQPITTLTNSSEKPNELSHNPQFKIDSSSQNSDIINNNNNNLEQNTINNQQEKIAETSANINNKIKTYLGHLPYQEGDRQRLVLVGKYYGKERFLDTEAANAFMKMKIDAQNQGIDLTIISGFRSIEEQETLFQKQIKKRGSKEAAARLSAPAGYSEHHTGYTLDIGDGNNPDQDLKFTFENTLAYQWLLTNAVNYGFELSFPKDNPQGVSFEPWHWRYIAPPNGSQIFAVARTLNLNLSTENQEKS